MISFPNCNPINIHFPVSVKLIGYYIYIFLFSAVALEIHTYIYVHMCMFTNFVYSIDGKVIRGLTESAQVDSGEISSVYC